METKPRRRLGILIFCFVFLAVAGAIGATVLLANDARHLHTLMRSLGMKVEETAAAPPQRVVDRFRGHRLKDIPVSVSPYLFQPILKGRESALLRNMRRNGETLCAHFDRLGFKMSSWQPGSFAKTLNECYSEVDIPNRADPNNPSSFFLMIKGEPDGTLVSARVKFIFNDADSRTKLTGMTARIFDELAEATAWGEVGVERSKLLALTPFTSDFSGVNVRFAPEFGGVGRYNLIFSRSGKLTPAEKRTQNYFDRSTFFPLTPQYGGPPIKDEPKEVPADASADTSATPDPSASQPGN
jgi:hypothetical protein